MRALCYKSFVRTCVFYICYFFSLFSFLSSLLFQPFTRCFFFTFHNALCITLLLLLLLKSERKTNVRNFLTTCNCNVANVVDRFKRREREKSLNCNVENKRLGSISTNFSVYLFCSVENVMHIDSLAILFIVFVFCHIAMGKFSGSMYTQYTYCT